MSFAENISIPAHSGQEEISYYLEQARYHELEVNKAMVEVRLHLIGLSRNLIELRNLIQYGDTP